jgi:hypothetical protein
MNSSPPILDFGLSEKRLQKTISRLFIHPFSRRQSKIQNRKSKIVSSFSTFHAVRAARDIPARRSAC